MNNKKGMWVGLGIVVLIIIFVLVSRKNYQFVGNDETNNPSGQESGAAQAPQTYPLPGTNKLSYGEAIKFFKNRFQFVNCHGTPGVISVKRGVPVMLDNRDKKAHTIKANSQSFRIAALDYTVVYPALATKDNVDMSLSNVTCDGGGAASLNVEK